MHFDKTCVHTHTHIIIHTRQYLVICGCMHTVLIGHDLLLLGSNKLYIHVRVDLLSLCKACSHLPEIETVTIIIVWNTSNCIKLCIH